MDRNTADDPNDTIIYDSTVGRRLSQMRKPGTTFIVFQGRRVPLTRRLSIGRGKENSIVLEDKLASRRHALIQKVRDAYFIQDLGSTNGTFLNGERLPSGKYVRLKLSDLIVIGRTELSLLHFR